MMLNENNDGLLADWKILECGQVIAINSPKFVESVLVANDMMGQMHSMIAEATNLDKKDGFLLTVIGNVKVFKNCQGHLDALCESLLDSVKKLLADSGQGHEQLCVLKELFKLGMKMPRPIGVVLLVSDGKASIDHGLLFVEGMGPEEIRKWCGEYMANAAKQVTKKFGVKCDVIEHGPDVKPKRSAGFQFPNLGNPERN